VTRIGYAANLSTLFTEVPFLDRFSRASAAGFSSVEFWFPHEYPMPTLRAQLKFNGLQLVLFNLRPGEFAAGDRGLLCDPTRRDEFRRTMDEGLHTARELGCALIHAMVGKTRPDLPRAAQYSCIIENLRWAAPNARDAGVTLLIEALNPYDNPGIFLMTSREAYNIVKDVGQPNVKFQFDFYHLQITEGDLTRNFLDHLSDIGHVQIADVPGRHEPGTGEINYPFVLNAIENSGYTGFVGLEYIPSSTTDESLQWLPRDAHGTHLT